MVAQQPTDVDKLLDLLERLRRRDLDGLLDNPAALRVTQASVRTKRVACNRLSAAAPPRPGCWQSAPWRRCARLDYVPTLIYALTDPDRRVVREARDGLRFVSRRFKGFGLDDNFDDDRQRDQAVDRWKTWYRTVRPDAPPIP